MDFKKVALRLNGKKLPIGILLAGIIAVSTLQAEVGNNIEDIKDLKTIPVQVAQMEQKVEDLDETFKDFRQEQRVFNKEIDNKLDKIFQAIIK